MPPNPTVSDRAVAALEKLDTLGVEATRIFLSVDRGRIASDADALDARAEAGESMPLYGLIISLKDLVDRKGEITTAGSQLLESRPPAKQDAEIVTRLEQAGALILGRTSLTEFAYSGVGLNPHHGTPGCIFDRKLIPGGSSSGAALSVAHGICDVAIGTDTGGSVRIPAAVNGLYGIKPTTGTVPLDGIHPLSPSMDSCGPLAATWQDAVQVLEVLRGEALDAPAKQPSGLRIGVPTGILVDELADDVRAAFDATLAHLKAAGTELVDMDLTWLGELPPANRLIVSTEAYKQYGSQLDKLEKVGDPNVLSRIRYCESASEEAIEAAYDLRAESITRFLRELADVDAIVAPTLPIGRPTIERAKAEFDVVNVGMLRNSSLINFVDGCAVSMPVSASASGVKGPAPFPLMVAAERGADARLVAAVTGLVAAVG